MKGDKSPKLEAAAPMKESAASLAETNNLFLFDEKGIIYSRITKEATQIASSHGCVLNNTLVSIHTVSILCVLFSTQLMLSV